MHWGRCPAAPLRPVRAVDSGDSGDSGGSGGGGGDVVLVPVHWGRYTQRRHVTL